MKIENVCTINWYDERPIFRGMVLLLRRFLRAENPFGFPFSLERPAAFAAYKNAQ
jgi:hypothetical protein